RLRRRRRAAAAWECGPPAGSWRARTGWTSGVLEIGAAPSFSRRPRPAVCPSRRPTAIIPGLATARQRPRYRSSGAPLMRHAPAIGFAGFVALVAGAVAFAQSTVEPLPENPPVDVAPLEADALAALAETRAGDAERGASLASTCTACHGMDGNPPDGLP